MSKENNKGFIFKLAAILFAITFIATLLLTLCNYITKDRIADLQAKTANEARQEVLPGANFTKIELSDNIKKEYDGAEVFKANKDGEFAGYCVNIKTDGYIDKINMMVGINPDMSFSGIKIISSSETPGLGAKTTEKDFYGQFSEEKKGTLTVVKSGAKSESEIQAVTGATISSKAVTKGANDALEIVKSLTDKEAR